MSRVFDDIVASLNELKDHAEGKSTGVIVHRQETTDENANEKEEAEA